MSIVSPIATATQATRVASIAGVQEAPFQAKVSRSQTPSVLMLNPMLSPRPVGKSAKAAAQAACICPRSISPPSGSSNPRPCTAAVSEKLDIQRKK